MIRDSLPIHLLLVYFIIFHAVQRVESLATNKSPKGREHRFGDNDSPKVFDAKHNERSLSRKKFFFRAANLVLLPTSVVIRAEDALAAAPVTPKETDSLGAMAKRALRPKPPKVLRRKLSMDFAVLLMRSSYNALDSLDCVAMDQFQRDFFLIRSSEYGPYVKEFGAGMVQQGDLTDPLYFDFISYAQYATINREISLDPPYLFEEQQPIDQGEDKPQKFVPVVIKRDPSLTNERLGPEHSRMVGESILEKLEEVFGKTDSKLPTIENNSRPDSATLLVGLKQLVNLFLVNGYAFNGSVSILSDSRDSTSAAGAKFLLSLNSPATIWSSKILQAEGAKVSNSFLTKAATEFVRHTGYKVSSTIKYDGTTENITIIVL